MGVYRMRIYTCGGRAPRALPPMHGAPEKFNQIDGADDAWADRHQVGVAAGAGEALKAGLREHFQGECTETGMYLAMARQADREGFPEIADAYKRIAWEEAGHAALFGEMLGEVLKADTRANVKVRAAAEHGACAGKADLADMAEKQGLFSVRDAVREMARTRPATAAYSRGYCAGILSPHKPYHRSVIKKKAPNGSSFGIHRVAG